MTAPAPTGTFKWWDEASGTWQSVRPPRGLQGPTGPRGDPAAPRLSPGFTVMTALSTAVPDGAVWGYGTWTVDTATSYPAADQCIEPDANDTFRFRRAGVAVINVFNSMSSGWMIDQRSIAWLTRGLDHNLNHARIASCCFNAGENCSSYTAMVKVEVGDVFFPAIQKWGNNMVPCDSRIRAGLLAG